MPYIEDQGVGSICVVLDVIRVSFRNVYIIMLNDFLAISSQ